MYDEISVLFCQFNDLYQMLQAITYILLYLGGTEDMEYLPIQMFRKGMIGCVGELSIGRVYAIDMIQLSLIHISEPTRPY